MFRPAAGAAKAAQDVMTLDQPAEQMGSQKTADEIIRYLRVQARGHMILSRQERYQALADVLEAYEWWSALDEKAQHHVLSEVSLAWSDGSRRKVYKMDPIRTFLRALITYPGQSAAESRRAVSTDANVLKHALEEGIPSSEFVNRISAEGEGRNKWSRPRPGPSSSTGESDQCNKAEIQEVLEQALDAINQDVFTMETEGDWAQKFPWDGYYGAILRRTHDGARFSIGWSEFIGQELGPNRLEAFKARAILPEV